MCPPSSEPPGETARHIRASGLFLFGRLLATGTNFLTQVLTVRYLSKGDYGAFSFGLAVAAMATNFALLGLHNGVSRYLPVYLERGDRNSSLGSLLLAGASVAGAGLFVLVLFFAFSAGLEGTWVRDRVSIELLLILIVLVPTSGLDEVLQSTVAVLGRPGAIFFRKHILGPGLKLLAVLLTSTLR